MNPPLVVLRRRRPVNIEYETSCSKGTEKASCWERSVDIRVSKWKYTVQNKTRAKLGFVHYPKLFPFRWNWNGVPGFCFDAFSSREPASTSPGKCSNSADRRNPPYSIVAKKRRFFEDGPTTRKTWRDDNNMSSKNQASKAKAPTLFVFVSGQTFLHERKHPHARCQFSACRLETDNSGLHALLHHARHFGGGMGGRRTDMSAFQFRFERAHR
jgi:hypothetical protein